jgi:hypothetical protein
MPQKYHMKWMIKIKRDQILLQFNKKKRMFIPSIILLSPI